MALHIGTHKGINIESYYVTGNASQVVEHLTRSLSSISRRDRPVIGSYVGIASGYDQFTALKNRIDDAKIAMGITRMVCVYESSSRTNTKYVERKLIERFKSLKRHYEFYNEASGGQGRPPLPDKTNYVYFALNT
ncbi:MAG: hypothetical protein AAGL96_06245 [Pseudomonadota bacterium]